MCIIYHGLEWYNLRELCERKFTTTARGILHLFHSVARVTVIDVGVDFVTINELAHKVLVLCEKLRLFRLYLRSRSFARCRHVDVHTHLLILLHIVEAVSYTHLTLPTNREV